MDNLNIEDLRDTDEYVPEDPNTPVDDFEISEIQIEDYMPEELKIAISRYNEVHKRTVEDLMHDEDLDEETDDINDNDNDIIEDKNNKINLKNIF